MVYQRFSHKVRQNGKNRGCASLRLFGGSPLVKESERERVSERLEVSLREKERERERAREKERGK